VTVRTGARRDKFPGPFLGQRLLPRASAAGESASLAVRDAGNENLMLSHVVRMVAWEQEYHLLCMLI
jgi:hypothetical protein